MAGLSRRADHAFARALERRRARLTQSSRLFDTLGYTAVLKRGFAIVKDENGNLLKTAAEVRPGAALRLEFADGEAGAVATGGAAPAKQPARTPAKPGGGGQGQLF